MIELNNWKDNEQKLIMFLSKRLWQLVTMSDKCVVVMEDLAHIQAERGDKLNQRRKSLRFFESIA